MNDDVIIFKRYHGHVILDVYFILSEILHLNNYSCTIVVYNVCI